MIRRNICLILTVVVIYAAASRNLIEGMNYDMANTIIQNRPYVYRKYVTLQELNAHESTTLIIDWEANEPFILNIMDVRWGHPIVVNNYWKSTTDGKLHIELTLVSEHLRSEGDIIVNGIMRY